LEEEKILLSEMFRCYSERPRQEKKNIMKSMVLGGLLLLGILGSCLADIVDDFKLPGELNNRGLSREGKNFTWTSGAVNIGAVRAFFHIPKFLVP
jgi:hypothetical protein